MNKEILCKCLLECKDEILVFTNFTSLVLISTMIALGYSFYNKEINLRLFKLKLAHIFNDVDDNLFTKIFGLTSVELVDKLINTTSKKDNQIIIDNIEIKRYKIYEEDKFNQLVIQPAHKRDDLFDTAKVLLDFNKIIQPYLT